MGDRYRCPVCRHWYERGGLTTRCLVMHPPGTCCHHGETPVVDSYDDIPAEWRAAADDLVGRVEKMRQVGNDLARDALKVRDDAEELWSAGNWARSYYETNDRRVQAVTRLNAATARATSLLDGCFCDDGRGDPECEACRRVREVWTILTAEESTEGAT